MRLFLITLVLSIFIVGAFSKGMMNVNKLSPKSKEFFLQMTRDVMDMHSFGPLNKAAKPFFKMSLAKYKAMDKAMKDDMTKHVPQFVKIFDEALLTYEVDHGAAYRILGTFFENFKKGLRGGN